MNLKHTLTSCFFAAATLADFRRVKLSPFVAYTPEAKHFIEDIKRHVLDSPPCAVRKLAHGSGDIRLDLDHPHIGGDTTSSLRLNRATGYDCYRTLQKFNTTLDDIQVDIIANEDLNVVSGSTETPMEIKTTTAIIDTDTTGWKVGSQTVDEWTPSLGIEGIPFFKPSVSYKHSQTNSKESSGGKDIKNEFREEVNQKRTCPPHTACSIQTWTFRVKLSGNCPVMPMVDPVCFATAKLQKNRPSNRPVFDLLKQSNWMRDYILLPAVNGQQENWTILGTHFYNMTKKDGSPSGKVQPAEEVDGVFMPSDEFNVNYKDNPTCQLISQVYRLDDSVQRVNIMLETKINDLNRLPLSEGIVQRADDDQPQPDIKISIIDDLVW